EGLTMGMDRRVVVTGMGLLTPVGTGIEENWSALTSGKSGIGPITQFDIKDFATKFAGEVKDFDATRWIDKREAKTHDRFINLGLVAAQLAWEDSGMTVDEASSERVG